MPVDNAYEDEGMSKKAARGALAILSGVLKGAGPVGGLASLGIDKLKPKKKILNPGIPEGAMAQIPQAPQPMIAPPPQSVMPQMPPQVMQALMRSQGGMPGMPPQGPQGPPPMNGPGMMPQGMPQKPPGM